MFDVFILSYLNTTPLFVSKTHICDDADLGEDYNENMVSQPTIHVLLSSSF